MNARDIVLALQARIPALTDDFTEFVGISSVVLILFCILISLMSAFSPVIWFSSSLFCSRISFNL